MEKITKKKQISVTSTVEKDVTAYKTSDGNYNSKESEAKDHEALIKAYPKISKEDIEWLEGSEHYDNLLDSFREIMDSGKEVLILMDPYDNDSYSYEKVDPVLAGVVAVVKLLHGRSVGMGGHESISGIIYKKESFCVDFKESTVGSGRNIKEVIK